MDTGSTEQRAWSAETARIVVETARRLAETLDTGELYDCFHELLGQTVPHDGLIVSRYDHETDLITCEFAWSDGVKLDPSTLPPLSPNPEGEGMQTRVIRSGETLLENDVGSRVASGKGTYYNVDASGDVRKIPETGRAEVRAAIMVPVKHEGRVVGVVQVMNDRLPYTREHAELVEALVGQMSAAVRAARLHEERSRAEAAAQAAEAVAAEREQAARVLAAVGDGIVLVGDDGRVRLINRAAERALSLRADEVVGRPLADAVPGWRVVEERVAPAEPAAPPQTLPVLVGEREVWLSANAVRSADGVVYAFRDETSEHLLDRAKSDFVATVSHELRTPLAGIYGAAVTLERRDAELSEEQQRQLLGVLVREAERLGQIVDEILLTAQIEAGRVTLSQERIDLRAEAEAAIQSARARSGDHRIELSAPASVPPVIADGGKLRQVLMNLLDNAIKYAPGGTRVEVTVAAEGPTVVTRVRDEGPGIPDDARGRIFEKVYRLDPEQRSGVSGTGLGLYISRELVERMGGELDVERGDGPGASFRLALPAETRNGR